MTKMITSNKFAGISVVSVLLAIFVFALNVSELSASNSNHELISVTDLTREAWLANKGRRVLMIEFSSEYCGYCLMLEEEFLRPMLRNSDYNEKVVIRSISLSDNDTLVDFDGKSISAYDFASRYEVFVTPTLLFLDDKGVEVSDKLVGIWSVDFYGGFIDDRIDSGLKSLL